MGYKADKHATLLPTPSGKRKGKLNFTLEVNGKKRKSTENLSVLPKAAHSQSTNYHVAEIVYDETSVQYASDFNFSNQIIDSGDPALEHFEGLDDRKQHYEATIKNWNEKFFGDASVQLRD